MVELAQLFQEVNELVMRQDETMVAVEGNAATAENDVKQAYVFFFPPSFSLLSFRIASRPGEIFHTDARR